MQNKIFSPMAIDALGEMMNISLGSSATAVSNMLDHRVDITTPTVTVVDVKDFTLGEIEPAIGIEIKYVSGLEGSNIMVLKKSDIKIIVDILMGMETPEEEFELNELSLSAVCEVMNQMMGSASTALSDFLGFSVNISTPKPFELDDLENFKGDYFPKGAETIVVVKFSLKIEDALESEFMNVISLELARELLSNFGLGDEIYADPNAPQPPVSAAPPAAPAASAPAPAASSGDSGRTLSQAEIEAMLAGNTEAPAPAAAPAAPAASAPAPAASGGGEMQQMMMLQMMQQMQQMMAQMPQMGAQQAARPEPKQINTSAVQMPQMLPDIGLGEEQAQNLDLIMEVPLQISVEIGRTQRKVQDILTFSKGSLVVLDKLAGDQVDIFVNGKCIAKGDVVVVDDSFGVRITEIM